MELDPSIAKEWLESRKIITEFLREEIDKTGAYVSDDYPEKLAERLIKHLGQNHYVLEKVN